MYRTFDFVSRANFFHLSTCSFPLNCHFFLCIKEHNALSNSQVLKLIVDRFVRQGRD